MHRDEMENLSHQQDFCYQHHNHLTLEVFDYDEDIEIIDFPSYSPDINSIENV